VFQGRWNRHLGWTMLVATFAAGIWLDPWSLGERNPALLPGSPRMAARHAQAVLAGMAFLQIMIAKLLAAQYFSRRAQNGCSLLSGCGAIVYATGYAVLGHWPEGAWLIVSGALMNLGAFSVLAAAQTTRPLPLEVRTVLLIFCFGMTLDALMGLSAANSAWIYVGPEDGVRLRMLRLARAAVIALSSLTLLYQDLALRTLDRPRLVRAGQVALMVGAVGMPLVLTLAGLTWVNLKYLLPIAAQATFAGVLVGAWLAWKLSRPLELWGWLLIALGMATGLFMGLYAFDGPMPAPGFLGAYNDFGRRLSRLGHAYCIVLGFASIFLSREASGQPTGDWAVRFGVAVLVAGVFMTVINILLLEPLALPKAVLSLGPALVTVGLGFAVVAKTFNRRYDLVDNFAKDTP
jgi:hypothetical protein